MPALPRFRHVQVTSPINGFSSRISAVAEKQDVRRVVSALKLGHLDPGGKEISDIGKFQDQNIDLTVRLDRQPNPTGGGSNLQVQVNDSVLMRRRIARHRNEGTTIAQAVVPAAIYQTAFRCPEQNVRTHLETVVRDALLASHASMGFPYTIKEVEEN